MVENTFTHKKDLESLLRKKGSFPQLSSEAMLRDVIDLKKNLTWHSYHSG